MDHINIASKSQENIHVQSKIDDFFDRFRIGTLLHRCGVRKRHGHGVRSLTQAIFTLPFVGKNFFRGIVINEDIAFGKDAAYQLLEGTSFNYNGKSMDLMAIYGKLKKRRGRARILASTQVQLKDGRKAKLVFVRDKRKKRLAGFINHRYLLAGC